MAQAQLGNKRLATTQQTKASGHVIHIVDQNGQPAISGVPSGGGQIFDVAVGQSGFTFSPNNVNISVGDTVRWTWFSSGHSVTSGNPCTSDGQFCSPDNMNCDQGVLSNTGTVYEFTFTQAGDYSYFCVAHCSLGMTGTINVSGSGSCSWAGGPDLPSVGTRFVGVFFPANGKFYLMGGRSTDVAGSDFMHPFEYDPVGNTWTTKAATYPDNQVNNMACGVLNDSGTDYIYCVGGSAGGGTTATDRVFRYNPLTDAIDNIAAPWPGDVGGVTLPGGFSAFQNKLYILGGFQIQTNMTDTIWEFTPGSNTWVQKNAVLPVPLGYIPTTTIGNFIYTGGGAAFDPTVILMPSTNSFRYDPMADSITTIASIPRPTDNTRGLNFCNQLYVVGGDDTTFPNPSNEVDIYDPLSDSWSLGQPFVDARRNFATDTDTDGINQIWVAGGYDVIDGITASMEIFNCPVSPCGSPSPTPTATATATATATPTATTTPSGTPTVTPSATGTVTPTPTPSGMRHTPTPRPRPTPAPRP